MSAEEKLDKIKRVTSLFDQFVDHIDDVRENIEGQKNYSEGYMACIQDILTSIKDGSKTELIDVIKTRLDMESREEVLTELMEGLENLRSAYNKVLSED